MLQLRLALARQTQTALRLVPSAAGPKTGSTCSFATVEGAGDKPVVRDPWHIRLSAVSSKEELLQSYSVTPPTQPWPKNLTPKRMILMISRQQNLDIALQIFEFASKYHRGFSHTYDTFATFITRLARARQFQRVETLLSQLRDSGIRDCREAIFITVIRNYGLASRPKDAIRTFLRIEDFGVQRSVRSLNCLLNALVQNNKYDWVHLIFKNSKDGFRVAPNVITCNILVKALCKKGDVDAAIKVMDEVPGLGIVPNLVTYTTLLGGYVQRMDLVGAKRVLGEILDKGWVPDATTYTILIHGYCKKGMFTDAAKVMDDMEANGVRPNEATYGAMIQAFCKVKKSGEAVNLLCDMVGRHFAPGANLCSKVIDLLGEEGKVEEASELWKKLVKKNVYPDNAISSTLIHWLCRSGKLREAKKLFNDLDKSSVPSVILYNELIDGMCEAGELCEAGKLWDNMVEKGCSPNVFTYNMLIKGFCKVGNPEGGIKIFSEMLEKGCFPNESTYSILIDGLSSSGLEGEILNLLARVASAGGRIHADSWRIILMKAVGNIDLKLKIDSEFLMDGT